MIARIGYWPTADPEKLRQTSVLAASTAHRHLPWAVIALLLVVPLAVALLLRIGSRPARRTPAMWLAGVDARHVRNTIDRATITSMGTMVVLIACAAAASMTFAITIVSPGPWAWLYHLPVGVVWGLIVLTIDRWIISATDFGAIDGEDDVRRAGQVGTMLGRVAMAAVVGLLISEPILFKLFDSEIRDQLRAMHDHDIAVKTAQLTKDYNDPSKHPADPNGLVSTALTNQRQAATRLAQTQQEATSAHQLATCELKGVAGRPECVQLMQQGRITGDPGYARQAQDAAAADARAAKAFSDAQVEKVKADQAVIAARGAVIVNKAAINQQRLAAITDMTKKVNADNGLLAREEALDQISASSLPALVTRLSVWGAFMLVDLLPLLLKVCTPAGEYRRLAKAEAIERVRNLTTTAIQHADEAAELRRIERTAQRDRVIADLKDATEREQFVRAESLETFRAKFGGDCATERELAFYEQSLDLHYGKEVADARHAARLVRLSALTPDPATEGFRRTMHSGRYGQRDRLSFDPLRINGLANGARPTGSPRGGPVGGLNGMLVGHRWLIRHPLKTTTSGQFPPWLAVDTYGEYHDEVVVKIIAPPNANYRERRRAERELAVPKGFIHENLAEILDSRFDDEHGYFVVTHRFPETLQERLTRTPAPPFTLLDALDVTLQVLHGLAAAWSRDIVHLDVKPANIGVDESGLMKLFDFGLQQRWRDQERDLTTSHTPQFTAFYAPPEQMQRTRGWNRRTADLRAVGAVLYWMLTGYPPMWREAYAQQLITKKGLYASDEAPLRTKELIATEDPAPASSLLAGLPPEVDALLQQWLHRDYTRRNPGREDAFANRLFAQLREVQSTVSAAGKGAMAVGRAVVEPPSPDLILSMTAGSLPVGDWKTDPYAPRDPDTETTEEGVSQLYHELARFEGTMSE